MPYSNIDKPSSYFNTKLYTGNGASLANTGVGFKPDFLWIKGRSGVRNHSLFDIVRGNDKRLISNSTGAETTETAVTSFDTDGFTLDSGTTANANGETFVAWNWLASNTTASNTSGSITSTVSANTTSGFSIVSYTGNGTAGATVGHGLGVTPKMVIIKNRSATTSWPVFTSMVTTQSSGDVFTSTVFNIGDKSGGVLSLNLSSAGISYGMDAQANGSGATYIAYCFAEVKGYSKFGSYVGNGSADGTFVYTGFKPAFVLLKSSSNSGWNWRLSDNKRDNFNSANNKNLFPSSSDAEVTSEKDIDFLSNGFKLRTNDNGVNTSGWTIIYMAFAENPFVSSKGIPTTAR
jgi:hypothetical protein